MQSFKEWFELNEEKDACYNKVKSRYRVWPSAYACVPIKTSKALTKEGWKTFEELSLGEEILTFSLEKETLEFKPILNLHNYKKAETYVIQNGKTGCKFECTPNHKWVVRYPRPTRNRLQRNFELINDMSLTSTEDLLKEKDGKRQLVVSSKYYGGKHINLDENYKHQTNWIEYLLNCSPAQREALINNATFCQEKQGCDPKNESDDKGLLGLHHKKQTFKFEEQETNCRDAYLLSAFLNQGLVTYKKNKNHNNYNCRCVPCNVIKSCEKFKIVETRQTDVWCPETDNSTWVMMQETDDNGIITITGNSGALVKCRKVGASNWGNSGKKKKHMAEHDQIDCSFCANPATMVEMWDEEVPICDQCSAGISEGTFDLENKKGLHGWFARNKGKGWIDCKKSKKGHLVPCGRKTAGKGAEREYPACRPNLSACNKKGTRRKKSSKPISWE